MCSALFRCHSPNRIGFCVIYIAEAHARDQWPMGETISCVDQPTTLEQRLVNAQQCQRDCQFEVPMLVDNMDNQFHLTYGSWPFRFYVIHHNQLVFKAQPDENTFEYDINQLDNWINNFYSTK